MTDPTGAERYLADRMNEPVYAEAYRQAKAALEADRHLPELQRIAAWVAHFREADQEHATIGELIDSLDTKAWPPEGCHQSHGDGQC